MRILRSLKVIQCQLLMFQSIGYLNESFKMTRYELVTEPPTLLWVTALSSQSAKSDKYLEFFFKSLKSFESKPFETIF